MIAIIPMRSVPFRLLVRHLRFTSEKLVRGGYHQVPDYFAQTSIEQLNHTAVFNDTTALFEVQKSLWIFDTRLKSYSAESLSSILSRGCVPAKDVSVYITCPAVSAGRF